MAVTILPPSTISSGTSPHPTHILLLFKNLQRHINALNITGDSQMWSSRWVYNQTCLLFQRFVCMVVVFLLSFIEHNRLKIHMFRRERSNSHTWYFFLTALIQRPNAPIFWCNWFCHGHQGGKRSRQRGQGESWCMVHSSPPLPAEVKHQEGVCPQGRWGRCVSGWAV